jgi:hypothetical protein
MLIYLDTFIGRSVLIFESWLILYRDCIQRETWCMGPYAGIDYCKSHNPHSQHEYGQAPILTGFIRDQLLFFFTWAPDPGVY